MINDKRLKSLVEAIAKGLVDYPTSIAVDVHCLNDGLYQIVIYTHPDDLKMVVGKGGKNINALRTLVYAMVAKYRVRCYVAVEENLSRH